MAETAAQRLGEQLLALLAQKEALASAEGGVVAQLEEKLREVGAGGWVQGAECALLCPWVCQRVVVVIVAQLEEQLREVRGGAFAFALQFLQSVQLCRNARHRLRRCEGQRRQAGCAHNGK